MHINILTVVPSEHFTKLVEERKITNLDLIPLIHPAIKRAISEYLRRNAGVEVGIPLATMSRFSGDSVRLDNLTVEIQDYLPVKPGTTIWQLEVKDDIIASIPYKTLLSYNNELKDTPEELHEDLMDLMKDEITLGGISDSEDVISFIPFIGLDHCRYVAAVDSNWEAKLVEVPGVKAVKLTSFGNIFS